jgi:phosphotransferase system enzyme I (PtsI)
MSTTLTGKAAAPGVALGPVFVVETSEDTGELPDTHQADSADAEKQRLDDALEQAARELRELAERVAEAAGQDEADIFEAHAEFASDPELRSMAGDAIDEGTSAERAVSQAFDTFKDLLSASASEYLAARVDDLDDVRDRVVRILLGVDTGVAVPDEPSVIVAETLSPSQTASIPRELISAIVTATGSPTSHAAILARSLGIPAVVGCDGLLDAVEADLVVGVDGGGGEVLIAPSDDEAEQLERRIEQEQQRREELKALRDEPGRTADGRHVELAANIGTPDDLAVAVEAGAEGSGLVRTEFLFLGRRRAPSVDDQVGFYTEVLRAFPGHRVVFRTMDIGADKPLPFVDREQEENPALGLRGIRLHLARPELLRDQLRALLRAAAEVADEDAGRLAIMFPLVSAVWEVRDARALLDEVAADEGADLDDLEVGIMIEVPSAALAAEKLAEHVDFFSIGTNDLLQYLFAADRVNADVPELQDVCEPGVLGLIGHVISSGHDHDAWVGVCGEAASDPTVAAALVGLGIDELSMTRVAIPEVKDTLRSLDSDDCRRAVERAIGEAKDGDEARRILEDDLGL